MQRAPWSRSSPSGARRGTRGSRSTRSAGRGSRRPALDLQEAPSSPIAVSGDVGRRRRPRLVASSPPALAAARSVGPLGEHALVVGREDLDELRQQLVPVVEDAPCDRGSGALEVLATSARTSMMSPSSSSSSWSSIVGLTPRGEACRPRRGRRPGRRSCPPRSCARSAEHDHAAAGHVLAAVVAEALDDGVGARVAHREALPASPRKKREPAVVEGVGDHGCEYMTGGRVVVLGRTGRNFAAGMSGGIAYVLDPDGELAGKVNPAMLDQLEALDEADEIECRSLVEEHARRTGSELAQRMLDDWGTAREQFVKVFPTDYKRVIAELAAEEAATVGEAPTAEEFRGEAVDVVGAPHTRLGDGE